MLIWGNRRSKHRLNQLKSNDSTGAKEKDLQNEDELALMRRYNPLINALGEPNKDLQKKNILAAAPGIFGRATVNHRNHVVELLKPRTEDELKFKHDVLSSDDDDEEFMKQQRAVWDAQEEKWRKQKEEVMALEEQEAENERKEKEEFRAWLKNPLNFK
jgi:hypothetical protein